MPETVLQIDPRDNVLVALVPLTAGTTVPFGPGSCPVTENIPPKHKLALIDMKPGDLVIMYGMVVGEATQPIPRGGLLSTRNTRHRTGGYTAQRHPVSFTLPDASPGPAAPSWATTAPTARSAPATTGSSFRSSSARTATSTACAKRSKKNSATAARRTAIARSSGKWSQSKPRAATASHSTLPARTDRIFPNIDGIRFLTHQGGCGGTRQDAQALCGLLAGYIHHPNVAGATVLSLGCQNAQSRAC